MHDYENKPLAVMLPPQEEPVAWDVRQVKLSDGRLCNLLTMYTPGAVKAYVLDAVDTMDLANGLREVNGATHAGIPVNVHARGGEWNVQGEADSTSPQPPSKRRARS
jgi:hypothetical protein